MKRNFIRIIAWVTSALISWSASAYAGPCDAHYSFDGTLADVSGNGYDGEMFNAGGPSSPKYTAGKFGKALQLDGTSAMRALLDLHYDSCPQVTMSAWIQVSRDISNDTMHVLSSGQGSGPGLRVSDTYLTLAGTNNGIGQPNAIRKGTNWTFVAGVYDYTAGHFTFYWGNRSSGAKDLAEYRYPPESAFWVGTVNDEWGIYASGIAIDDLRISGSVSSAEQVAALRTGRAISNQVGGTSGTSAPQPQPTQPTGGIDSEDDAAARPKDVVDSPKPDLGVISKDDAAARPKDVVDSPKPDVGVISEDDAAARPKDVVDSPKPDLGVISKDDAAARPKDVVDSPKPDVGVISKDDAAARPKDVVDSPKPDAGVISKDDAAARPKDVVDSPKPDVGVISKDDAAARTEDVVDSPKPDVGVQGRPIQLPGDQYEPAQLPGDQYEPAQLPGDQYEPTQLPGDQYEPTQLPGDQYEAIQLPGDQYEPTQLPK